MNSNGALVEGQESARKNTPRELMSRVTPLISAALPGCQIVIGNCKFRRSTARRSSSGGSTLGIVLETKPSWTEGNGRVLTLALLARKREVTFE